MFTHCLPSQPSTLVTFGGWGGVIQNALRPKYAEARKAFPKNPAAAMPGGQETSYPGTLHSMQSKGPGYTDGEPWRWGIIFPVFPKPCKNHPQKHQFHSWFFGFVQPVSRKTTGEDYLPQLLNATSEH